MKQVFRNRELVLPLVSALFLALARLPYYFDWLSLIGFVPLFILFEKALSWKQSFFAALSFTIVYVSVALHWISLVTIGGFLGIYILFTLYFFLLFRIYSVFETFPMRIFAMICIWISFEYLQSLGEFRFPWLNLGYSLVHFLPLLQPAELAGVYGISFLILVANWLLYRSIRQKIFLLWFFFFFFVWAGWGKWRLHHLPLNATKHNFAIVQVSIPQEKKWEPAYLDSTLTIYRKFTEKAASRADLVIWPESALPVYLAKQELFREDVFRLSKQTETDIFTGFPDYEFASAEHPLKYKFFNSASLFDVSGKMHDIYRKNILVPFGERMPFLDIFPVLWNVQLGQANFEYGKSVVSYPFFDYQYSPLICFEIAFPDFARKISANADFFVNLTNDAWFKRSIGCYQHAMMAVMRAVETRTQVFRAANSGYSMVVSPSGTILQQSKLFEKTILREQLYIYSGNSIFTKYLGWFPLAFMFGALVMVGLSVMQKKRKSS